VEPQPETQPEPHREAKHAAPLDLSSLALLDSQIDPGVFGNDNLYTIEELSAKTGWSAEELDQLWLWAGLPFPDPAHALFKDSDVEGLTKLREFKNQENFSERALASLVRSIGVNVERLAAWQVEALTTHLADSRGIGDTAARMEAAAFAPAQTEILQFLVEKLWLRHYASAIHRLTTENILRRGVSDDDQQFPHTAGVGFAWIVDYIPHTRGFGLHELQEFVQDFHDRVSDIANANGARIITNSFDFVLYVTARPDTGADIALRLANMSKEGFPAQVHGAMVWTRLLSNYGDLYGPGVDLSRLLAQAAAPGQVLTDPETAEMLRRSAHFTVTPVPEVDLPGIGIVQPEQITRA